MLLVISLTPDDRRRLEVNKESIVDRLLLKYYRR
jgi:hypothetical protein